MNGGGCTRYKTKYDYAMRLCPFGPVKCKQWRTRHDGNGGQGGESPDNRGKDRPHDTAGDAMEPPPPIEHTISLNGGDKGGEGEVCGKHAKGDPTFCRQELGGIWRGAREFGEWRQG